MLATMQKPRHFKTFVERIGPRRATALYLIKTADDHDRLCWFLMKAEPINVLKLERTSVGELVDLTRYGKQLAAGWGHTPDKKALGAWYDILDVIS